MPIDQLPQSPNGEISHNQVREKINEVISEITLPPVHLRSKQDVLDNGVLLGSEITMVHGAYLLGVVDLGADTMVIEGGSVVIGTSSELSSLTSSSPVATVIFRNGGFVSSGMIGQAGIKINNSSNGVSILATGSGTIAFFNNLFTNQGTVGVQIEDASGIGINNYTIVNGGTGVLMTGSNNTGPILNMINPINCTGKGIDIQGDITSGALRIRDANITSDGIGVDISGNILGMEFSGDSISQSANGMKISGNVPGGALFLKTNIVSMAEDAVDITGSLFSSFIAQEAGMTAVAANKFGLVGDVDSANITNAGIVSTSFIDGLGTGGGALKGITKKDIRWSFSRSGEKITDSRNIGAFTLSAPASTIFASAGDDGTITAYTDIGGGFTTVTSAGHGIANGEPVAINGTVTYNGVFIASGVTASTFNITRIFVSDEATGVWESGWVKVSGTTIPNSTIERFEHSDNNELTSLDPKVIPVTYSATISGSKSGTTANQYQFAVFEDFGDGLGFVKVNGSLPTDFTNRGGSASTRVPTEINSGGRLSLYIRNMDGTTAFDCVALSVDIGIS